LHIQSLSSIQDKNVMLKKIVGLLGLIVAIGSGVGFSVAAESNPVYAGKPATAETIAANKAFAATLNFADTRAFELTNKGLVAELDADTAAIMRKDFEFIGAEIPDTVNPSLYRQAQLNQAANGLYKVTEGIYQVRGTDLSNLTLIRGKTGWILYDVLLTQEAAARSLKFALSHLPEGGDLPVTAMIYSHSPAEHFGGARAIVELYPNIPVYGPAGLTKEIVDENVLAGNAMSRRAAYQYGATLATGDRGIVDAALGKGLSKGTITYVKPTHTVAHAGVAAIEVDGLNMLFLNMPGAEAPAEMVTYIPSLTALWTAELTYHGMHNIYTLRGAKIRDALAWSKHLNQLLALWGADVEVLFAAHSAPIWGNQEVSEFLRLQRDNYGVLHNQTMRLANNGVVMQDIGDAVMQTIPKAIFDAWHTNGYHGTYSHNAKGIYNMYLGYFDMNPANLNPLSTRLEAEKFVEYMGGGDAVVKRAAIAFTQGDYRFVATALNKVVMADPAHNNARQLLADTYEQLGYQSEGAGWRNIYLTAAQELRIGIRAGAPRSGSRDVLQAMDMGVLFDFIAIRVDSKIAETHGLVTLNIVNTTNQAIFYVELSNGNLSNIEVGQLRDADTSLYITRADFGMLLAGGVKLPVLLGEGRARMEGDKTALGKIFSSLVAFDPNFEIVPLPPE
jgi:alkyl sulfatase BDS1-like metallo-beta-lactamase superfamily hydrolase